MRMSLRICRSCFPLRLSAATTSMSIVVKPSIPAELLSLIRLYSNYRNIAERELLVEYVDDALDTIKRLRIKRPLSTL